MVELRGFEMPPHPRMALVQALLVRALIARFWHAPYAGAARPLGHASCTTGSCSRGGWRPTSPRSTADLRRHGFAFAADWLEPFLEFRFPRLGGVIVDGVELELRMAIEPWNVLGEEQGAATARVTSTPRSSACRCGSTG